LGVFLRRSRTKPGQSVSIIEPLDVDLAYLHTLS
jgi:hypothetical protein